MDQDSRLFVQERLDLCTLLASLSPEEWRAATLDEGWTVEDLAAHMVLRERHSLAMARAILFRGRLGPSVDALMTREKAGGPAALLAALRTMPPLLFRLPGIAARGNLSEAYIHNEDARRGALDRPRQAPAELQQALWGALALTSTLMGRSLRAISVPGVLTLEWPGHERRELSVGRKGSGGADAAATLSGEPGELLLWLTGRKDAASVHLEGAPALVAALSAAPLSL